MPSKTGNTYASYYQRDLQINQTSNTGVDATTRTVQSGDGADSALSLSDDVLQVQPNTDNTTGTFLVKNQGGSNILTVDTSSSLVKAGASQVNTLTLVKEYGLWDASPTAGTHHLMAVANFLHSSGSATYVPQAFGTGTNPSTSLTHSADPTYYLPTYWLLNNNITIDQVQILATSNGDTTMNFHVMAFDCVTGSGSSAGNLTNGVHHATSGTTDPDSLSPITVENNRITNTTLTIETADIDSGKVVLATAENVGGTDDISVQLNITYHIR